MDREKRRAELRKHGDSHDEKNHGNWARGGGKGKASSKRAPRIFSLGGRSTTSDIKKAGFKKNQLITLDMKRGEPVTGKIQGARSRGYPAKDWDEWHSGTEIILDVRSPAKYAGKTLRVPIRQADSVHSGGKLNWR